MSTFDFYCPELSPNSTNPNMQAESCAYRVKTKQGKCAKCPSGVGYVAPVKKKPGRKPGPPKLPEKRYCKCGNEIERRKVKCSKCLAKNRVISQAKQRAKQERNRIKASIEHHKKKLVELRSRLEEIGS